MRKDVSISIIMPAYNVADYIQDTLDSIWNQTEIPDEIIIVDDGSIDNTVELISTHKLNNKIQLICTENYGQGVARNIGIRNAKSDFLYFFDSDDLLVSSFIEDIKNQIRKYPDVDLILFSGESFKDKSNGTVTFTPPSYIRPFECRNVSQDKFLNLMTQHPDLSCSPCLYVSRRTLWEEHQLHFNQYYHEDEEIFYPLIFSSERLSISRKVFFKRRIRVNSTMTSSKTEKHLNGQEAILNSLLALIEFNKEKPLRLKLLRRRISRNIPAYISVAKSTRTNLNINLIFQSLIKSKSFMALAKALVFLLLRNKHH